MQVLLTSLIQTLLQAERFDVGGEFESGGRPEGQVEALSLYVRTPGARHALMLVDVVEGGIEKTEFRTSSAADSETSGHVLLEGPILSVRAEQEFYAPPNASDDLQSFIMRFVVESVSGERLTISRSETSNALMAISKA